MHSAMPAARRSAASGAQVVHRAERGVDRAVVGDRVAAVVGLAARALQQRHQVQVGDAELAQVAEPLADAAERAGEAVDVGDVADPARAANQSGVISRSWSRTRNSSGRDSTCRRTRSCSDIWRRSGVRPVHRREPTLDRRPVRAEPRRGDARPRRDARKGVVHVVCLITRPSVLSVDVQALTPTILLPSPTALTDRMTTSAVRRPAPRATIDDVAREAGAAGWRRSAERCAITPTWPTPPSSGSSPSTVCSTSPMRNVSRLASGRTWDGGPRVAAVDELVHERGDVRRRGGARRSAVRPPHRHREPGSA